MYCSYVPSKCLVSRFYLDLGSFLDLDFDLGSFLNLDFDLGSFLDYTVPKVPK